MELVQVGNCSTIENYFIGGVVGIASWSSMIENVFVKAEFDVPDVQKAYVAGAVAASIGGKQNPMIH